ncbi:NAD-dependent epimerase/dehydratase family protein [Microbacterium atlanticum]|uniref:NAD-dependent epimerase/dehydratase family protein n=1 Tax=Microbacterium atlanticum TaxID=2782168 RepID=UPI001887536D|nr:NAD-dependent epimerase/dehydratase family protein [Microbacterium atlanticum]
MKKAFVTGAGGYVGSRLVTELSENGWRVTGLAHTDADAETVRRAGATVAHGGLDDIDVLRRHAAESDAVLHLAFRHDLADYSEAVAIDRRTIRILAESLSPGGRLATTGATASLPAASAGTEDDLADPAAPRVGSEEETGAVRASGVGATLVRLPPSVHGPDDVRGFVTRLLALAQASGRSAYVGDGEFLWPAVHKDDAVRVYRAAVETEEAPAVLHAVGEEGVPFRRIAEAIGARAGVPTVSLDLAAAAEHFGPLARFATLHNPTSSALTRARTGWAPTGPTLLADIADTAVYAS